MHLNHSFLNWFIINDNAYGHIPVDLYVTTSPNIPGTKSFLICQSSIQD